MNTLDPLGRDRTQDLSLHLDADAPPTQPATRVAVPQPPSLPEYPDHAAAFIANAVKAATSGAPQPPHLLLAMGVQGADVEYTTRDTALQQRMDAFKESATPTFHTKEGDVQVAIAFHMRPRGPSFFEQPDGPQPFVQQERTALSHRGELNTIGASVGVTGKELDDVASGRGTPENVRRVTQALIDAGKMPPEPASDAWSCIRTMMCNYGVGLDCAGYVQQAFLASRGITRSQAGFRVAANEDLSGLAARGFKSVSLDQARAGDLLILSPPPHQSVGHTIIIRDSRMADAQEADALARCRPDWGHPSPSTIQRFEFDSAWGNFANPLSGGAERQIYWHDTASDQWMYQVGQEWFVESKTTYLGHPIEGVYRPAGEP